SDAVDSLLDQSIKIDIFVVDNGSTDGSYDFLKDKYEDNIILHQNKKNKGFAGGANNVLRHAIENGYDYVALLNSDAKAHKEWTLSLASVLDENKKAGVSTSKILKLDGKTIDTTGEQFYTWGLSSPRGRDEKDNGQYNKECQVFGGSGGASMYRVSMLKEVGLFDEDFFAYYEDADLSFRANLAGWKVIYTPKAIVEHEIGASSSKVSGLAYKMSVKNQIMLLVKNVPLKNYFQIMLRFKVLWIGNIVSGLKQGYFKQTISSLLILIVLLPKKFIQRVKIQRLRKKKNINADDIYMLISPGYPKIINDNTTVKLVRKLSFWR
ncbi:MAG TPA: glycosyltransferase family 2 protein, partial [Candidatus Saccharimonadales bacterium]|nr:glycosyltransferase family 2 protein [Candidatus Saccharimonadales bacterium]